MTKELERADFEIGVDQGKGSDSTVVKLHLKGEVPCVICWEMITEEMAARGEVLFNFGKYFYPAHAFHFTPPEDGDLEGDEKLKRGRLNMIRFAFAYGIGEGLDMRPDDQDELRPIYDEIEKKMKGWNHPVLFG